MYGGVPNMLNIVFINFLSGYLKIMKKEIIGYDNKTEICEKNQSLRNTTFEHVLKNCKKGDTILQSFVYTRLYAVGLSYIS